ncbi:serine/threonine-protein phosphatase 7 long form homolog [Cicer arietinum]|uniref:serine/threonine-protein phosphatase 7 long form homolog n=1 Tax=Cicer arietinum TaxID=3827 RepID=UPI003CC5993B
MALLRNQYLHRSRDIAEMVSGCNHLIIEEPNEMIVPYLEEAGFFTVAKLRSCNVDPSLVTAMVERWRTKTHTFHLPIGECTITLEDVALQLGLPINGRPITGGGALDWDEECQQLLSVIPPKNQMVGQFVKLEWLKDTFAHVPNNAAAEQVQQHCRAYLLRLIGGLTNVSCNRTVLCMYGWLYIAPSILGMFIWMPYRGLENAIPQQAYQDSMIWTAKIALICFSTVEWHQTDRVKLQFKLLQEIPDEPENIDTLHCQDMRGNHLENWKDKHAAWIQFWNERRSHCLTGQPIHGHPIPTEEYMVWFRHNSNLYLSALHLLRDPRCSVAEEPTQPSHRQRRNRPRLPTPLLLLKMKR